MKVTAKYILAGALFLRLLFAADVSVASGIQSFSGQTAFSANFETDGGHKLARSASGKLHAIFVDVDSNSKKLIRAYSANGLSFTMAIVTENNDSSARLHDPALAVSGEDVYVVYADIKSGADRRLSILKYTGDGGSQEYARVTLDNSEIFYQADITLDTAGYIYVAVTFSSYRKARIFRSNIQRSIASGFTEEKYNGGDFNTTRAYWPKLAADETGNIYLAYEMRESDVKRIAVHKRIKTDASGSGIWSAAIEVSPNFRAQNPDIVFHDGKLHMVYSEQPNNIINENCNLRYWTYDYNSFAKNDTIILSDKKIYSPRLSFSGDTPLIQYTGSTDGNTYHIKQTARKTDGAWSAPVNLSNTPNAVYPHNVASVVNDLPDVLWYNTTDEKVYFAARADLPDMVAPVNGGVTINNGEALTKNPVLKLTLSASDAGSGVASMNISETNSLSANWLSYAASREYTLGDQTRNQTKTLYVWYRDKAGNVSAVSTQSIYLTDAGGSGGKLVIDNNAEYANTINVILTVSEAHALAKEMRIWNEGDTPPAAWETTKNVSKAWKLKTGDGTKTVNIEFRNAYGNVTWNGTADSIILDTTKPTGTLQINNGETLTKNAILQLTLSASDSGGGVASMNISETNSPSVNWLAYNNSHTYTLNNQTPGNKTVYVWYRDKAGNIGTTISASIALSDAGGAGGAVKINNDSPYTNTRNVTLSFSNNHALAYDMHISDGVADKWVSVNTTLAWTLPSGDGTKTISVEYRNMAGNVTWNGSGDTIALDTIAPAVISPMESLVSNNSSPVFTWIATDNHKDNYASGVSTCNIYWGIAADGSSPIASQTGGSYAPTPLSAQETYYLRVRPLDKAGNAGNWVTVAKYIYDTTAPVNAAVAINNGDAYTVTASVRLTLEVSGAVSMNISDTAVQSSWLAYAASTNYAWKLSSGDGPKNIHVWYRDAAGNETHVTAAIYLDTVSPAGSLTINGGETLTKNPVLQLTLSASDGGSGLANMRISESPVYADSGWETYSASKTHTLQDTAIGNKTIYVWLKDAAGNTSNMITNSIVLTDSGGSGGKILINGDAAYTNNKSVTLVVSEIHALAQDMRVWNSGETAGIWVSKNVAPGAWTLTDTDGLKTVNIEFRNAHGNVTWSGTADSIILDTDAPSGTLEINGGETTTDNAILKLALTASSDTVSMNINETDAWSIWQNYSTQSSYALLDAATGNKTIYLWLKDEAGNISATISASLILDGSTSGGATPDVAVPAAVVPVGKKIYSYPNPAQPRKEDITIAYSADKDGVVNIYLYNILGEKIWSASGYARVGAKNEVVWNGHDAYGSEAGNGVYILLLTDERKKVLARGRLTILDD